LNRSIPLLSLAICLALAGEAVAANDPAARALQLLQAQPQRARLASADRLQVRDVLLDADGTEHVRLERSHGGLPVIGGDLVVHSRGGLLRSVSLTQAAPLALSLRPTLSVDEARVRAGAEFDGELGALPTATLVVYARTARPALAWQVRVEGTDREGNAADMSYIVDARNGRVLDRWSNFETITPTACSGAAAAGTGRTLYAGNVAIGITNCGNGSFHAKDQTRGNGYTIDLQGTTNAGVVLADPDGSFGNNTAADRVTVGADAHYGVARTWDYYKNVHGRSGIANNGKGALARVHYGTNYANAMWNETCFCMNFGDGNGTVYGPLVSVDIAGHEMSHGVTKRTAALVYSGEAGALNEATSDIFGTMVEFYAANAQDAGDYLIGEKILIAGGGTKGLRYMYKPSLDGKSVDCWTPTIYSKNVHYSSGVANHFFYLLAEGSAAKVFSNGSVSSPTCNGSSRTGIGRAKAEKIWYRALTVYMTSNTNYAGARVATINAAKDLYGASSPEAAAVAATWSAVNVN
jgi:Zn-dependent metalloprotease